MPDRIVRTDEARARFGGGCSRATWWKWVQRPGFPRKFRLGPNSVGWSETELEAWLQRQREPDPDLVAGQR
jgi:predicted DNA-binding transcriptional regulator AlpA